MIQIYMIRSKATKDILHVAVQKPWHEQDPSLEVIEGVALTKEEVAANEETAAQLHKKIEELRRKWNEGKK